jgi:predicted CopG family antitoxin
MKIPIKPHRNRRLHISLTEESYEKLGRMAEDANRSNSYVIDFLIAHAWEEKLEEMKKGLPKNVRRT